MLPSPHSPPPAGRRDDARAWVALALALAALGALRYLVIAFGASAYDVAKYYMADDAFYYFQIARNLARGLGSTFDGVHPTNGYHPLWLLVSSATFALVPGESAPLVVLYALQVALLLGSAVLLFRALAKVDRVAAAFTVALLLASWHGRKILFTGMESSLAFALASALLWRAAHLGERFFVPARAREAAVTGALLVALSLSRLEAGLFAAIWVVTALLLDARRGAHARRRIVAVALGLAVVAAAYVGGNLWLVGVPVPISGLVKTGARHTWAVSSGILSGHRDAFIGLVAPPGGSGPARAIGSAETVAMLVAPFVWWWRERRAHPAVVTALLPWLGFAAAFVAISAFVTGGIWAWYRWPALLAGVIATFALVHVTLTLLRSARWALALLAVVSAVALVPDWYLTLREHPLADWSPLRGFVMDETIRFIREEIPPGERIGGVSNGIFTYFSGRQIENLEGLANGAEFYRARRDTAGYARYLRENRIRWIVLHAWSSDDRAWRFRTWVPASQVERVYDLDGFYGLDLARTAFPPDRPRPASLSEPNVYFVRLKP